MKRAWMKSLSTHKSLLSFGELQLTINHEYEEVNVQLAKGLWK